MHAEERTVREAFKRFPPWRGDLLVPSRSRGTALAALALYPACRSRAARAQRIAWELVRIAGPKALPGRSVTWEPPVPAPVWAELSACWRERLGAWNDAAVFHRPQPGRRGLALLLLQDGAPLAFVKLRDQADPLERESRALAAIHVYGPHSFSVPDAIALEETAGWWWLALAPLPPRIHRVPRDPALEPILEDIGAALEMLPRPAGTPGHWRPMHGDFTPWNLREMPGIGLFLLDWEHVGWAPPGADRVLFRATIAAINGSAANRAEFAEAIEFWQDATRDREPGMGEQRLADGLVRALREME
jgi:hypothetical protein